MDSTDLAPSPAMLALEVEGLSKAFVTKRNLVGLPVERYQAVADVSLTVAMGETVALVGESGSGKSTIARLITRLEKPDSGTVRVVGEDWSSASLRQLRRVRRTIQMVFQNPYASLDPTQMVLDTVGEPLRVHFGLKSSALRNRTAQLLDSVGLPNTAMLKYPHEFSGGQRQRIAIARALASEPKVIIADEAVSALDVSTQAKILNLFRDIQEESGVGLLFITHDLSVVRQVADRITVLKAGSVVESGDCDTILNHPQDSYTKRLIHAVPRISDRV